VGNGSGVSRGDRNRNARLVRLRGLVPVTNAIVGIDLADKKQMVVVCDHDSKVLARRTFRCRAWDLGAALDWVAYAGTDDRRGTDRSLTKTTHADVRMSVGDGVHLGEQGPDRRRARSRRPSVLTAIIDADAFAVRSGWPARRPRVRSSVGGGGPRRRPACPRWLRAGRTRAAGHCTTTSSTDTSPGLPRQHVMRVPLNARSLHTVPGGSYGLARRRPGRQLLSAPGVCR
jgi:hypothetical protein